MSVKELSKYVKVIWKDAFGQKIGDGPIKKCEVTTTFTAMHAMNIEEYDDLDTSTAKYIQEKTLKELHDGIRDTIYPEVQEVLYELKGFEYATSMLMNIRGTDEYLYKGEPLNSFINGLIRKLECRE